MITDVTRPLPPGSQRGPQGYLAGMPGGLALGTGSSGEITVTAAGGPVRWAATTSTAQVSLSSYSGTLRAGHGITLVVSVSRTEGSGGSAVVTISAGSAARAIVVTWSAASPHEYRNPPPSPSPSDSGSSPSPTPSPSPS
jgi:hypothetical protein